MGIYRKLNPTEHVSDPSRLLKAFDQRMSDRNAKRRFDSIEHFSDMAALKRMFDSIKRVSDMSAVKRYFDSIGYYSDMNEIKRNGN